ncbi:unnamed protein product [Echinostoma caproni]|uniref:Reverse transcriptase domain-containing protein n=1 Tax=Echinostoma caproni TaxID=27848 RepID=A0A183B193_9TREM|nr:unnamed protein product [Echinostoma caproni]
MESIISIAVFQLICPQAKIHPTSVRILGVTANKLPLIGEVSLMVHSKEHRLVPIHFLIAKSSPCKLGLTAIRELNHRVSLHTNFMSNMHTHLQHMVVKCSNNTGGMNVQPVKLEVDGEPIFLKQRVIPYGQRDGVLQALEKMEREGTITLVTSSTWAKPIVIAIQSDGKILRICGDYRLTLNPRLRKCAATTMEPEDFMKALHGSTCFSKIDLADAYLQISLAPTCRQFTTINTSWGLYQYNFLPFGLHTSSGIFQAAIDEVIRGLDGVLPYQDYVIVFGTTKAEHDDRLLKLLEWFAIKNVSIRASKCMFSSPELEFLGFTVDTQRCRPDPSRFRPLTELESPRDQNQLTSIMGCP